MRNAKSKFRRRPAGGLVAALAVAALATGCMAPPEPVQPVALAVPAPPPGPPKPKGQVGTASWYGPGFTGKKTANGEVFDDAKLTAAHKSLPFDTEVKVTHLDSGKSVRVRINDRGPHVKGRLIDLSRKAAETLDIKDDGVARVRVERVTPHDDEVAANPPEDAAPTP